MGTRERGRWVVRTGSRPRFLDWDNRTTGRIHFPAMTLFPALSLQWSLRNNDVCQNHISFAQMYGQYTSLWFWNRPTCKVFIRLLLSGQSVLKRTQQKKQNGTCLLPSRAWAGRKRLILPHIQSSERTPATSHAKRAVVFRVPHLLVASQKKAIFLVRIRVLRFRLICLWRSRGQKTRRPKILVYQIYFSDATNDVQ